MNKIIFLDIDGVMNSHTLWDKLEKEYEKTGIRHEELKDEIDHYSCIVLKEIIDSTDSKVVISSTWRLNYYDFLKDFLSKYKIDVIDKTGRGCQECVRGNEILTWIKENEKITKCSYHEYKNYVILDDDSDMLYWQRDNFVQISGDLGLTRKYKKKIIRILNQ